MVPREMIIAEKHKEDSSEQSGISQYNTPLMREWINQVSEKILIFIYFLYLIEIINSLIEEAQHDPKPRKIMKTIPKHIKFVKLQII